MRLAESERGDPNEGDPAPSDLTAKAQLREVALRLFAERGVGATSVRSIAAAAGVSPGLVIHHYGSKDGLRAAVDEAVVARITRALGEVPLDGSGGEVIEQRAEVLARALQPQPAVFQYIARALSEDSEGADELFRRLFAAARADRALEDAGAIRADSDPFWRALQQLVLIVGPLLLRRPIERELGGSLLERENFERWMRATADLLRRGLYTEAPPTGSRRS
jgi:TetR/AcrR family transcriptional regulator, regulator of cefoperazone and chloramphenicol sensitivity